MVATQEPTPLHPSQKKAGWWLVGCHTLHLTCPECAAEYEVQLGRDCEILLGPPLHGVLYPDFVCQARRRRSKKLCSFGGPVRLVGWS